MLLSAASTQIQNLRPCQWPYCRRCSAHRHCKRDATASVSIQLSKATAAKWPHDATCMLFVTIRASCKHNFLLRNNSIGQNPVLNGSDQHSFSAWNNVQDALEFSFPTKKMEKQPTIQLGHLDVLLVLSKYR